MKTNKKPGRPKKNNTKSKYVKDAMEIGASKSWADKAYRLKQLLNNQ